MTEYNDVEKMAMMRSAVKAFSMLALFILGSMLIAYIFMSTDTVSDKFLPSFVLISVIVNFVLLTVSSLKAKEQIVEYYGKKTWLYIALFYFLLGALLIIYGFNLLGILSIVVGLFNPLLFWVMIIFPVVSLFF